MIDPNRPDTRDEVAEGRPLSAVPTVTDPVPEEAGSWRFEAFSRYGEGRYEEALEAAEKAIELDSEDAEAWRQKAMALLRLERVGEALEAADRAIGIAPTDGAAWGVKAFALFKAGRHEEAIEAADRAVGIDPSNTDAWRTKGLAFTALDEGEQALAADRTAAQLAPEQAVHVVDQAVDLVNLGRFEEGLEVADRAIQMAPDDAIAWRSRAAALEAFGRHAEALESAERSTELDPDDAPAWRVKAWALLAVGRHEDALGSVERALELDPQDAGAWRAKASALASLGRKYEARAAVAQNASIRPSRRPSAEPLWVVEESGSRRAKVVRWFSLDNTNLGLAQTERYFRGTAFLREPTLAPLEGKLALHLKRVSVMDRGIREWVLLSFVVLVALSCGLAVLFPLTSWLVTNTPGVGWVDYAIATAGSVVALVVPFLFVWLYALAAQKPSSWRVILAALWVSTLTVVGAVLVSQGGGAVHWVLVTSLLPGLVAMWAFILFLLVVALARRRATGEWFRKNFASAMVLELSVLLGELSDESKAWEQPAVKRTMAARLERVARWIEDAMPGQLRCNDEATFAWLKEVSRDMAAYFRSLAQEIYLPGRGFPDTCYASVASAMEKILDGRWGELERTKPPHVALGQRVSPLLSWSRNVAVALLPGAVFFVSERIGLRIEPPTSSYVAAGAIIWAALSLLSGLDPYLKDKVNVLKEVSALLPTSRKERS